MPVRPRLFDQWGERRQDKWLAANGRPGPKTVPTDTGPPPPGGYTGPTPPPPSQGWGNYGYPGANPPAAPGAPPAAPGAIDPQMQKWINQQIRGMREGYQDPKWSYEDWKQYQNYGPANRQDIRGLMEAAAAQGIGRKGLNTIMSRPFLDNVDMGGGSREGSIMDYLATDPEMLRSVLRGSRQGDFPASWGEDHTAGQTNLFDAHPELKNIYLMGMHANGGNAGYGGNRGFLDAMEWAQTQDPNSIWGQRGQSLEDRYNGYLDDGTRLSFGMDDTQRLYDILGREQQGLVSSNPQSIWYVPEGMEAPTRRWGEEGWEYTGGPEGYGVRRSPGTSTPPPGTPPVPGGGTPGGAPSPYTPPGTSPLGALGGGMPMSFSSGQAGDNLLAQLYPWANFSFESPEWKYQGDANAKGGPGNRDPWETDYPGGNFNPWQSQYPGGVPLSGDQEAMRRAAQMKLQNDLGFLTYQKNQIQPMMNMGLQRMAGDYEQARDSLAQDFVARGGYDSGVREAAMGQQRNMFDRAIQDQVLGAQQAMGQANYGISSSWMDYYQQMAERALAGTQAAYQTPNMPVRY